MLNRGAPHGETDGLEGAGPQRGRNEYAPNLRLNVVIADPSVVEDTDDLESVAARLGATVVLRQVRTGETLCNHDPLRLAAAFRDAFDGVMGDVAWTATD